MTAPLGEEYLAEVQAAVDAYGSHLATGFACCSAHAPADAAAALLAEVARQRKVILRLTDGAGSGVQRVRMYQSVSGAWRVRWMLDGRRKATTCSSEAEARDFAGRLQAESGAQ